jgi:hypothetical protein
MKLRMIKLTPEFLTKAVQGKTEAFASNLPDDTELLDIKYDVFSKQIYAVVRSNSFEDVAESHPIPEFNLVYSASTKAAVQPATKAKTKPEPTAVSKPEVNSASKIQTQPSRNTNEMEEEFSPEQRKLLSFKVEGDYLIVKPIQFLKAEWDDINEVVRSLGGKWIKGDIISYWEVPLQQS